MLRNTFLHVNGIGPVAERKLWQAGLTDWDGFLAAHAGGGLPSARLAQFVPDIEESHRRFASNDWKYFDRHLPTLEKWRAYADLGSRAAYVDIETNGGMGPGDITVIGIFHAGKYRAFIAEENLSEAVEVLEQYPLVVTYNGAQFDLPLIRARFPVNLFNHIHLDLRYPLRRLGYRGGLKAIEAATGIARSPATTGLTGWDAVRLWREHRDGSPHALGLLLEYNREDVANLALLMDLAFARLRAELPAPAAK